METGAPHNRRETVDRVVDSRGLGYRRIRDQPVLGRSGELADFRKAIGAPRSCEPVEASLERSRCLGPPATKRRRVGSELIESGGKLVEIFALQLEERIVEWVGHG